MKRKRFDSNSAGPKQSTQFKLRILRGNCALKKLNLRQFFINRTPLEMHLATGFDSSMR